MRRRAPRRTAYYARVLKADVPLALDVLADILSEPAFDRDELIREQNVIVQEIGAVADTPDDLIFEHLQVIAFPDQPLGRSILGTAKTVSSFDGGEAARLSRQELSGAGHRGGRRRRRRPSGGGRRGGEAFCQLQRPRESGAGARELRRRHAMWRSATSNRCISR